MDSGVQDLPREAREGVKGGTHDERSEVSRSAAPPRPSGAAAPGSRSRAQRCAKYIDTTTCIGCKACEVACQEWNDLPVVPTQQDGTYQTLPTLHAHYWNLIKFNERDVDGGLDMADAQGPVHALRGAGVPRGLPRARRHRPVRERHRRRESRPVHRLRLLRDRLPVRRAALLSRRPGRWPSARSASTASTWASSPPASRRARPDASHFGTKDDMVALGNAARRAAQGQRVRAGGALRPAGVGGTGVVTVLAHGDHPEWYGLPADPHVPLLVKFWKSVLRPHRRRRDLRRGDRRLRPLHEVRPKGSDGTDDRTNLPTVDGRESEKTMSAARPPARLTAPSSRLNRRKTSWSETRSSATTGLRA